MKKSCKKKKQQPKSKFSYKYRVRVIQTTLEADPHETPTSYEWVDFDEKNLILARLKSFAWCYQKAAELEEKGRYVLPFAPPSSFQIGKHAAYSVSICLVMSDGNNELEFGIIGYEDDAAKEGFEVERMIFDEHALPYQPCDENEFLNFRSINADNAPFFREN
jgi:hypothetical protein